MVEKIQKGCLNQMVNISGMTVNFGWVPWELCISSIIRNRQEIVFSLAWKCSTCPVWCPLPLGFVKLNFDGNTAGNTGRAGVGGIMWDSVLLQLTFTL